MVMKTICCYNYKLSLSITLSSANKEMHHTCDIYMYTYPVGCVCIYVLKIIRLFSPLYHILSLSLSCFSLRLISGLNPPIREGQRPLVLQLVILLKAVESEITTFLIETNRK